MYHKCHVGTLPISRVSLYEEDIGVKYFLGASLNLLEATISWVQQTKQKLYIFLFRVQTFLLGRAGSL